MNMTIACTLRWGVASIEIFYTRLGSLLIGKIIQVQGRHRWKVLIRGYSSTESRHMAFIIIFVKSVKRMFAFFYID